MPEPEWKRIHACKDSAGRKHELAVIVTAANDVVLHAPPGEVARFHPSAIDDLGAARLVASTQRGCQ